jgi:uncharacterized protein (TIGR03435 family)
MIAQLTNHLWQSTVFCLAVAITAFLLRPNRAHVRYALWFAASVKFLLPFSLLVSLGALVPIRTASPASAPIPPGAFSITVDQLTQPFPEIASPAPAASSQHLPWMAVAIAIWFAMFAAVVVVRLRAWRRIRHAVRAGVPLRLHTGDIIDVRSSSTTLEPGVVGLWRPILLVPDRITERLTPRQLETVIAHELCHVRRRDNLTAVVHMGVEAVCWFHPLVWWIGARLVAERERACDEAVLEQGLLPRDYADAILNVCKLCVESPLACVAGVTGANIRKRLDDIMLQHTGATLTFARKMALSAATLAALAAPLVVGSITAPLRAQSQSQSQSQSQDQSQRFEVASIRPCDPAAAPPPGGRSGGAGPNLSPDRLHIGCMSVTQLINVAYILNGERLLNDDPDSFMPSGGDASGRIRGGPAWARDGKFEIEAKASGPTDRKVLQGPMLRALLEERFHLKIHRAEDQNVDMFALTVAKGGPKIKPWATEHECTDWDRATQKPPPPKDVLEIVRRGEKPPCGLGIMMGDRGSNKTFAVNGQEMDNIAYWLSAAAGQHVLNRTGLKGKYTLYLEYAAENSGADATAPSVFNAVQEQWGLKLEPTKGPRGYIVIDAVERPSNSIQANANRVQTQTFDVASIRPCDPHDNAPVRVPLGGRGAGPALDVSPGRLNVGCVTVAELVNIAYVQHGDPAPVNRLPPIMLEGDDDTIRGGPKWVRTEKYTIEASAQGAPPRSIVLGAMLRSLLEDRFQLKLHQDTKQVSAFALRVADQGLKLRPVDPNSCVMPDPDHPGPRVSKMTPTGTKATFAPYAQAGAKPFCGAAMGGDLNGPGVTYDATGQPFDQLARTMSRTLGRPVVNETHVDGQFTFHLEFARDENVAGLPVPPGSAPAPAPADPSGPSVFAAFEKQLGLVFAPTKAPQGFLVIDQVERPRAGG